VVCWLVVLLFARSCACAADLVPVEELGVRIAPGFRVTQYADSDVANDIYAMTLDSHGNVVVTSRGYIKTLFDRDGDGRAETATNFASTVTGGMGLCFDGNDLYFCGDGFLSRYQDGDGNGQADGPPEHLLPLDFSEHGGHAMRKGPDGWWYVIAGNSTSFTNVHVTLPSSPIRQIEAGALLRLTPDCRRSEAIAQGLRNAYDFDFNPLGDIFTYDSDGESDIFLPWYSPTRIYHLAWGGHHGWHLSGWGRTWARPDYYADTTDILYSIGRGSPTGVTCYRHYQFPARYQNGLFALDWTFGKVYFLGLQPDGASYRPTPEVFLEANGTQGFDPTDIVVTPDGSLLISIGGRKTRGAIYRVEYVAEPGRADSAKNWVTRAASELEAVLSAPQPLDAWSRAQWMPSAIRLGPEPFAEVIGTERLRPDVRMRAVEILTELYGGLDAKTATAGARSGNQYVRARVAWSMGRAPNEGCLPVLLALTRDAEPMVRRWALDALVEQARVLDNATIQQALAPNLGHAEKRVRQSAARLATHLPDAAWNALWAQQAKGSPQTRLTLALALLWRSQTNNIINPQAGEAALNVLAHDKIPDHRLQAVRLIIVALGDYHLHNPSVEVFTGYEPGLPLPHNPDLLRRIAAAVRPLLDSGDFLVQAESSRLLAMIEDNDPETARALFSFLTAKSSATEDFHTLTVLARLKAPFPSNAAPRLANALLSLDRKLDGQDMRPKQNWTTRLDEVVQVLAAREPGLAVALLEHPAFVSPGHIHFASCLGATNAYIAAHLFAEAVQAEPRFPWSGPLIDLLGLLPQEDVHPLFRRQWSNPALRDSLLLQLSKKPVLLDREKFIAGLSSLQPGVVHASVAALLKLPSATHAVSPALRLLRRLQTEPKEEATRAAVLGLLTYETSHPFAIMEQATDATNLKRIYQPVFDWCKQQNPALASLLDGEDQEDAAKWNALLKRVQWQQGDRLRGEAIFTERGCQICHAGTAPLGPDLTGVTSRFSTTDLFNAIIFPNRDVAPAYRTTVFQTRDGQTYNGIVAYESAEGVILQSGAASTMRLAEADILARQPSSLSLMPSGLLEGLTPPDLASLYSYLKTLGPSRP
jgi:putative membrane-bound dehydrogenase-like protein